MEKEKTGILLKNISIDDTKNYLFFLLENGNLIKLIALGLNNITSKNNNNLTEFGVHNIEYFENKNQNGGKLKKIILVQKPIINKIDKFIFWEMISIIFIKKEIWTKNLYNILLYFVNHNEFEYEIEVIFILLKIIIENENFKINIYYCDNCNSKEKISSFDLDKNGLICKNCLKNYNLILSEIFLKKIIILWDQKDIVLYAQHKIFFTKFEKNYLVNQFINFYENSLGIDLKLLSKI